MLNADVKVGIIKKMLGACSGTEAKFIIRGLQVFRWRKKSTSFFTFSMCSYVSK